MKFLNSCFILMFLGSTAFATALDVPTGDFSYSNTQAVRTKHVHRLYQRSAAEKLMIDSYRANGYTCKRQNSAITDCSKYIETNPNKIEFQSEKLALLSPSFSQKIEGIEEISSSDSVTVYQITQTNSLNERQNAVYKAYDINGSGLYLDLNVDNFTQVRFELVNSRVLSRFSFQKEKLSNREHYLHGLTSYYIK